MKTSVEDEKAPSDGHGRGPAAYGFRPSKRNPWDIVSDIKTRTVSPMDESSHSMDGSSFNGSRSDINEDHGIKGISHNIGLDIM